MVNQLEHATEALRKALVQVERLKNQNRALLERSGEPIAIVGMACRYPGGVDSPEDLWQLVAEGRDAIVGVPRRPRLGPRAASTTPTPTHRASRTPARAASSTTPAEFDAEFFGIARARRWRWTRSSGCCWSCLGGARGRRHRPGLAARAARPASSPGVIAGDYGTAGRRRGVEGYRLTGTPASVASGRVAYTLGLEGPAVTVDTACSSSLVALHLAVPGAALGRVRRWRWPAA